jgi:hypothetical protein
MQEIDLGRCQRDTSEVQARCGLERVCGRGHAGSAAARTEMGGRRTCCLTECLAVWHT